MDRHGNGARPEGPAGRDRSERPEGFALPLVLVVLTALYVGATGLFLTAKAELRVAVSHVAASRAHYLADAGLATWLAAAVQPARLDVSIGGETVEVRAAPLLRIDSVSVLYRIEARVRVGTDRPGDPAASERRASTLGLRTGGGPVKAVRGTWREAL